MCSESVARWPKAVWFGSPLCPNEPIHVETTRGPSSGFEASGRLDYFKEKRGAKQGFFSAVINLPKKFPV